jgi:hypothetical protein
MGVDGCWCALWSSKPVFGVGSLIGGFDSHILPPNSLIMVIHIKEVCIVGYADFFIFWNPYKKEKPIELNSMGLISTLIIFYLC